MENLNTRSKILLAILGLTIVYFLYDYDILSFGGGAESENSQDGSVKNVEEKHTIDIDKIDMYIAAARVSKLDFDADWDKDPFFYVVYDTIKTAAKDSDEEKPDLNFELVGISWQGGYGYALIGEEILQENDIIDGYIVEKISSDYVILSKGDSTIKLTLND